MSLLSFTIREQILQATNSQSIAKVEKVQSLWSDYGVIVRCHLQGGDHSSVVVKHIQYAREGNHPRGWNTAISHQRKLKSYDIEDNWYNGPGQKVNPHCPTPALIKSWKKDGEMLMILEDLNSVGFSIRKSSVAYSDIKVCLDWLANFHAQHMGQEPNGLWPIGSYWHLATRQDEWNAMQNLPLKNAAKTIDQRLNQAKYQTIIHGDAKLANFCFSADGNQVAAVDFQYVGGGCGMKDVAYFLSSCINDREFDSVEQELLDQYFKSLETALNNRYISIDIQEVMKEWRALYPYAWADFYRFLDGWSPGHWKMHKYSERMVQKVLQELNDQNQVQH